MKLSKSNHYQPIAFVGHDRRLFVMGTDHGNFLEMAEAIDLRSSRGWQSLSPKILKYQTKENPENVECWCPIEI